MATAKANAAVPILLAVVSVTDALNAKAYAIATGSISMETVEQELRLRFAQFKAA